MSKNIYRINKKSDLDEIMKNNFLKPVCIVFVSKNLDTNLYNDITTSILSISKQHTYNMIILIDFDDFIDNNNFFDTIKSNLPYFLAFFKGKNIISIDNKDNFIPIIINKMEEIHQSYISRLINAFNQSQENQSLLQDSTINNLQVNNTNIEEQDKLSEIKDTKNKKEQKKIKKLEISKEEIIEEQESESESESEDQVLEEESEENIENTEKRSKISIDTSNTEMIKKNKDKLKKLKELQKLKNMLKN